MPLLIYSAKHVLKVPAYRGTRLKVRRTPRCPAAQMAGCAVRRKRSGGGAAQRFYAPAGEEPSRAARRPRRSAKPARRAAASSKASAPAWRGGQEPT